MKNDGAIVWWINADCSLQSLIIKPFQLKKGHTYESEALMLIDGEHIVIRIAEAESPAEKERFERFKKKAEEMRNARNSQIAYPEPATA